MFHIKKKTFEILMKFKLEEKPANSILITHRRIKFETLF